MSTKSNSSARKLQSSSVNNKNIDNNFTPNTLLQSEQEIINATYNSNNMEIDDNVNVSSLTLANTNKVYIAPVHQIPR
ncbi:hypothetical protein C1645_828039 [Glomus cerebriforme]|uniref:Uncharacterized protein n=1 Tax=Glomus cerebriforme TaxID=658196 RepID=A0A397SQQ8_9GLOM|nr:hypothetical protein C1645_828039 [Glomus cerebriforme]